MYGSANATKMLAALESLDDEKGEHRDGAAQKERAGRTHARRDEYLNWIVGEDKASEILAVVEAPSGTDRWDRS